MKRGNVAIFVPHLGCPHDCSFCNQRRITGAQAVPTPEEVERTVRRALSVLGPSAEQSEIAFFGGSFTAVEPGLMRSLLDAAFPFVGKGGFRGIRVSTRPDAVDPGRLTILRRHGVTSVELGAQSMDDRVLALNARGHTAEDVRKAAALVKEFGFELGLQMMTGLYGDTPEGALFTAGELAELKPRTMRVYPTIVLRGTALEELYLSGRYRPQTLEEAVPLGARLLKFFHEKEIRVIRLGLHASDGVEQGYAAGPWHPAFRELCENAIYIESAREALRKTPANRTVLRVGPGNVSKLAGQKRSNLSALERELGINLKIKEKEGLPEFAVEAEAIE